MELWGFWIAKRPVKDMELWGFLHRRVCVCVCVCVCVTGGVVCVCWFDFLGVINYKQAFLIATGIPNSAALPAGW